MTPIFLGLEGPSLTAEERAFLADAKPWGIVVFARNIVTPAQVRALTDSVRDAVGGEIHIAVDQEGGRVCRLKPPHWRVVPRPAAFANLFSQNAEAGRRATWLNARLMAGELSALGIDIDFAPVLDVARASTHWSHGDSRCISRDPDVVAELGRQTCRGLMAGGVLPVVKHIPGHGAAAEDSHEVLPSVPLDRETLERIDFAPFRVLNDMPAAMVVHVAYPALDPEALPSTFSPAIGHVIRHDIGFDGLLLSDDLFMNALSGTYEERIARVLAAGTEIPLFCHGDVRARGRAVAATPDPGPETRARMDGCWRRVEAYRAAASDFDPAAARAELDALLAGVWTAAEEDWPEVTFKPAISVRG